MGRTYSGPAKCDGTLNASVQYRCSIHTDAFVARREHAGCITATSFYLQQWSPPCWRYTMSQQFNVGKLRYASKLLLLWVELHSSRNMRICELSWHNTGVRFLHVDSLFVRVKCTSNMVAFGFMISLMPPLYLVYTWRILVPVIRTNGNSVFIGRKNYDQTLMVLAQYVNETTERLFVVRSNRSRSHSLIKNKSVRFDADAARKNSWNNCVRCSVQFHRSTCSHSELAMSAQAPTMGNGGMHPPKNLRWGMAIVPSPNTDG